MIPGRPKNQYKALHKLVPPSMASSLHDRTLCGEENGADVRYVVFPFEIRERILQLISFRAASFSCAITESISTRGVVLRPSYLFHKATLSPPSSSLRKISSIFAFSSYLFPRSFRSSSVCFSPPQFVVVFPLRCSCSRSTMKNAIRLALLLLCSCLAVTSAAGPTSRGQIDLLVMTRSHLLSPSILGYWFHTYTQCGKIQRFC